MSWDWKNETDVTKFLADRHDTLVAKRKLLEPLAILCVKIFHPRRYDMLGTEEDGQQYGAQIFNPQPAIARSKFSRGMIGNMIGKGDEDPWWLDFTVVKQWLMDVDDVKKYFQAAQEQIRHGFAQSTFYRESQPFMDDASVNLAAVMIPTEDIKKNETIFQTIHPRDNYIAQDEFGRVNVYSRPLTLDARTAFGMFGDVKKNPHAKPENLPASLVEDAAKKPFSEYKFLHTMDVNIYADEDKIGPTFMPWVQHYICVSGDRKKVVEFSGHPSGPIVLRFGRQSGQTYATPPAADALTAALMGNKLSEKLIEAAHVAVENRWVASQGLEGAINLDARGITFVEDVQKEEVKALNDKLSWPVGDAQMDKFDDAVDEVFLVHLFEMLTSLRHRQPQKTAFETNAMLEEKLPQALPVIEATEDDMLQPATDYIWYQQESKGLMPDAPQILIDELEKPRKIINRYTGALGILRRRIRNVRAIANQLEMVKVLTEVWPSAALKVKSHDYMEHVMITTGMKQKHLVEDAEFEEIEAGIAQRDAEQYELEKAERMAKIVPAGLKGAEKGSLLEAVAE